MTRSCILPLTLSVFLISCANHDADRVALQDVETEAKAALAARDWSEALALAERGIRANDGDIACRYIAAVAGREVGAGLISRNSAWKSARRQFEWILGRDSSYEDVLYQFALLERYQGNRDRALDLVRAQIAKKPGLAGAQIGIYRLYRYFMGVGNPDEFLEWLGGQPGVLPRYFAGESLRRSGNVVAADSVLSAVLHERGEVSLPAIRLSLSRVRFAQGEKRAAEAEYWKAVSGIDNALGSAIMFEDLKYIVSDRELDEFTGIDSVAQCREFFRSFWNSRNPSMALNANLRLQEHMRRYLYAEAHYEYYGFRSRFNNPDEMHELRFPRTFALNDQFNDMGLISIRQGEPDDVLRASMTPYDNEEYLFGSKSFAVVHSKGLDSDNTWGARIMVSEERERLRDGLRLSSSQQDPCEAWLYNATAGSPKMVFFFQKHNTGSDNWRLSPAPSNAEMISDLGMWDVRYQRLASERGINRIVAESEAKETATTLVRHALTTDRQTWEKGKEVFQFPHSIDVFRAPDGRSLVDVSYAIPLAVLSRGLPDSVKSIPVEIGFSLVDARSRHVAVHRDTITVGFSRTRTGTIIDLIRYTVPPDSYAVSMHMRPLLADMIGTWKQDVNVRNFTSGGFMMSSVQFLRSSTEKGALAIDGVKVVQSPFGTHERAEPFYVYFQLYNLVADASGATSYRAECILLPRGEEDTANGTVVSTCEKKGSGETAAVLCPIDFRAIDPGRYTLLVRATDRMRVQTMTAERDINIVNP